MRKIWLLLIILWGGKGFAQVSLQTGASQISLPIFSYSDKDNLTCNISLDYIDGNGLKVNEVASVVGTGWNLQCGGVITREQRGLPDDQKRSNAYSNPPANMTFDEYYDKYFPNGYLFSAYSPSDDIPNEGAYVKMYQSSTMNPATLDGNIPVKESIAADREQDVFHLDYGKGKVEFVIGKDGQIKVLNDSKIKIEMFQSDMTNLNIKTRIDHFIITDVDGIQYVFADKELSQTCTYNHARFLESGLFSLDETPPHKDLMWYYQGSNPPDPGVPIFIGERTQNYIVTKWYLTTILNPRTTESISFTYQQYDINMLGERQIRANVTTGQSTKMSVTINREIIKALRLVNITCPDKMVNFLYYSSNRVDLPNAKPLTEIRIVKDNAVLKKYIFDYGYFFKSEIKPYYYQFTSSENWFARLCLKSIQEIGSNEMARLPYLFDYYTGGSNYGIVPAPFSYWSDHWGYSNPHNGYISEVQPNSIPLYALYNICTNADVKAPVNERAQNGIIKQIVYPSGGSLNYEYEQNDAFYNGQNVTVGGVRVKKTVLYDGINHNNDIIKEYKYLKNDGTSSSGWGYEPHVYSIPMDVRTYKVAGGRVGLTFGDFAGSFATSFLYANGGYYNSVSTKFNNAVVSFGNALAFQVIAQFFIAIISPSEPEYSDKTETEYSNTSNQSRDPLPFQYSRVEEINTMLNSTTNGKTIYEFTSDQETPINILNFTFPFSDKDRYIKWAYGLPKRTAIYDNTGKILREAINEYNVLASFMTDTDFMSKTWKANKILYDAFPSVHAPFNYIGEDYITESIYYPQVGHNELISTKERIYNKNASAYEEKVTTYTYNSGNFQPETITSTNSKGHTIQQKFYYPEDYTSTGIFTTLVNNNIINVPISSETWITKGTGQPQLLSATATDFGVVSNGDIKPVKIYGLESSAPVSQATLQPFNANSAVRDPNYIKEEQQYIYDNSGNLIQTTSNGRISGTLYDYDGRYPSMQIINASTGKYAYSSFEAENKGGWNYTLTNVHEQLVPTGNKCYQLGTSDNINTNVVISKPFILSFWSTTNNIQINGSFAPKKVVSGISGWTYYEFELPANSASPVITGNAFIDELRLYPKDARMVTYTFDEYGSKTSECDNNNHILYYEYNAFNQLVLIRDQNKNVVKKYCYNYAGQQEDCDFKYVSDLRTQTFTATSCDANHHPDGPVVYTVPAGKYSSGISKEDANLKAQQEIDLNGQNYANDNVFCVSNNLYAKLTIENQSGDHADVVIRFFDDAACTVPYPAFNLEVSLNEDEVNDYFGNPNTNTYNVLCNGYEVVALSSVVLIEHINDEVQSTTYRFYSLNPGDGYTAAY